MTLYSGCGTPPLVCAGNHLKDDCVPTNFMYA